MRLNVVLLLITGLLPAILLGCNPRGLGGGGDEGHGPLVQELDIEKVSFNQGVEIEIMDDGDVVDDRNSPVIAGRDGIVRIYVDRKSGWEDRKVKGVLELYDGDEVVETFDRERTVDMNSNEGDIDSTINLEVPGDALEMGYDYKVSLHEVEDDASGDVGRAEWPSGDPEELDLENAGRPLHVVIVPVRYGADGSNRVPDVEGDQLGYYRDWLKRLYPTEEVDLEVEDPVSWNWAISPWGEGWGDLLNYMINYRDSNNYDEDVYVYGLFNPASSFAGYCNEGCILGLSLLAQSASDSWMRVSIGVGFYGEDSAHTMAHEVGHAHGREHAPCGVDDADYYYPYDDARLGVAGWDIIDEELIEDDHAYDVMSYCDPPWISDYSYQAIYDRMEDVAAMAHATGFEPVTWHKAMVTPSGDLRPLDGALTTRRPAEGELRRVDLLDAQGELLEKVDARFYRFSHIDGGLLLYPEPGADVSSLRLGDASLDL